jgi:hypothetical protein
VLFPAVFAHQRVDLTGKTVKSTPLSAWKLPNVLAMLRISNTGVLLMADLL